MAETNDNIQDLIEQITCKMLLNDVEFNYLDNKDENQKAKRKKIHDEKKEEINEIIKALCSVVEKQLPPGIAAPPGLNALIAQRMLFEMKDGKGATKEFANLDAKTILNDFKITPVSYRSRDNFETEMMREQDKNDVLRGTEFRNEEKSYFKDVSNFPKLNELNTASKEDVQNFIEQVHKNGGLVNARDINVSFRYDGPQSEKYTEEQKTEDEIINEAAEYFSDALLSTNPKEKQKLMKNFEEFCENCGIPAKTDAYMRALTDACNTRKIDYNSLDVIKGVEEWAYSFQHEEGYVFDAHSAGKVLEFLSIVEQRCDENNKKRIFTTINEICPEVYNIHEQNPNLIDALMSMNNIGGDIVSDILLEGEPSGTVKEFAQGIEKFCREHSQEEIDQMAKKWRELQKEDNEPVVDRNISQDDSRNDLEVVESQENILPGLEEQEEVKQPELEQERPEPERDKTQLTMEEKMENFKKNMLKMAQAKGAAAALKFANNLIMNRNDVEREALTNSVIEVVAQDEFIQTAKEDDLSTIREIIGGCLDEDNKKQNPQLIDYVQALGGVSKDIKSRIKAQDMIVDVDTKSIGAQQSSRDDDEPEL